MPEHDLAWFPAFAKALMQRSGRTCPAGKDLTVYATQGGNVAEWVRGELARLLPSSAA